MQSVDEIECQYLGILLLLPAYELVAFIHVVVQNFEIWSAPTQADDIFMSQF